MVAGLAPSGRCLHPTPTAGPGPELGSFALLGSLHMESPYGNVRGTECLIRWPTAPQCSRRNQQKCHGLGSPGLEGHLLPFTGRMPWKPTLLQGRG